LLSSLKKTLKKMRKSNKGMRKAVIVWNWGEFCYKDFGFNYTVPGQHIAVVEK